jgi:hypothetical protein
MLDVLRVNFQGCQSYYFFGRGVRCSPRNGPKKADKRNTKAPKGPQKASVQNDGLVTLASWGRVDPQRRCARGQLVFNIAPWEVIWLLGVQFDPNGGKLTPSGEDHMFAHLSILGDIGPNFTPWGVLVLSKLSSEVVFFSRCLWPGTDVTITIFCDFRQFSAKNWRFSQKPMLWSNFCII